jgi:hypothetical protein
MQQEIERKGSVASGQDAVVLARQALQAGSSSHSSTAHTPPMPTRELETFLRGRVGSRRPRRPITRR